jgi:hypothetical protein
MSLGAQNMKTRPDALDTPENESGRANLENGIRRHRYRRKRVWEYKTCKREPTPSVQPKMSYGVQNIKMGPDVFGAAEN